MALMNAVPQNITQLEHRIKQEFSPEIAKQLSTYFGLHQFDEWQDALDDINQSYDDCCCKQILFKCLQVTDHTQKKQQYLRLKECTTTTTITTHPIFQDIGRIFTKCFNSDISANILNLFTKVIEDEFDGIESDSIQVDVEEITNSSIIQYVTTHMNYSLLPTTTTKENSQEIIANGIKYICNHQTEQFYMKFVEQNKNEVVSVVSDIDMIVNQIKKQLNENIATLFETCVSEEGFDDLEGIQLDVEDINDSSIFDYILENMRMQPNNLNLIQTTIKDIVLRPHFHNASADRVKDTSYETKESKNDRDKVDEIKSKISESISFKYTTLVENVLDGQNWNLDDLYEDVEDVNNSEVLTAFADIKDDEERQQVQEDVQDIILRCKEQEWDFDIKEFKFTVTEDQVERVSKFVTTHCHNVYQHLMGIAQTLTQNDLSHKGDTSQLQLQQPVVEGKSLCIAKCIDGNNRKPIMYWLMMLFSLERSAKYRDGHLNTNKKYTVLDWWQENAYCRWISKTYQKMAENMKAGLSDLVKRTLPPMRYNYKLFPTICDSLDDFVHYTLAFQRVAYHIVNLMKDPDHIFNAAPIQIDYWIIPRITKKRKMYQSAVMGANLQKEPEYKHLADQDNDKEHCIWDIENMLRDPKLGYVRDTDYFVRDAPKDFNQLLQRDFLFGMMHNHHLFGANDTQRRNRYIFIIDRRDPYNIRAKALAKKPKLIEEKKYADKIYMIGPKKYRNAKKEPLCICGEKLRNISKQKLKATAQCDWCDDRICDMADDELFIWFCDYCPKEGDYVHTNCHNEEVYILCSNSCEQARPETYGTLSKKWENLPESCLSLSKKYVLFNPNQELAPPITLDDALNGYMFALSYHILKEDMINVYWYHNAAGTIFQLSDMEHGWPQWFDKVNGQKQKIKPQILSAIQDPKQQYYNACYPELPNKEFNKFKKQVEKI